MKVGDSIRISIDDWQRGQAESAMLHACNAVDGTAKKVYPSLCNNDRFTRVLRENYNILGPMATPGIDIVTTRWPVVVARPKAQGGKPDLADVIYGIHRCAHGHGDELPDGFELIPNAAGPDRITQMCVARGRVRLSDRTIFGLLAVAVLSTVNVGQTVPEGYFLSFAGQRFPINDWWGRASDFVTIISREPLPNVTLNFGDWTTDT